MNIRHVLLGITTAFMLFPTQSSLNAATATTVKSATAASNKDWLGLPKFDPKALYRSTEDQNKTIHNIITQDMPLTLAQERLLLDLEIDNRFTENFFKDCNPYSRLGKEMTQHTLLQSTTAEVIQYRQQALKYLIQHPDVLKKLRKAIKEFAQYEDAIISSFKTTDQIDEQFVYWRMPGLKATNKSPVSLETGSILQNMIQLVSLSGLGYGTWVIGQGLQHTLEVAPYFAYLSGMTVLYGSAYLYDTNRRESIYYHVQDYLIKVQRGLFAMQMAYKELRKTAELANLLDSNGLFDLFEKQGTRTAELSHLLSLLNSSTFKGNASVFSLSGRILAAYKELTETHTQLTEGLRAIGELDMYIALARLIAKQTQNPVRFCFVTFENKKIPHISIKEGWHAYLDAKNAVTNSIEIGNKNARVMVISGPNTGGKSTLVKMIVWNSLLAHTFGIAAAQECTMTHHQIKTNLAQSNGVAQGLSGFDGQTKRILELIAQVQSTPANEPILLVADEMCSAADGGKNGPALEYATTKFFGNHTNCMMLIATHTPILFDFANTMPNIYKNIHVKAYVNDNGIIERPFKIFDGANNHQGVALNLAAQRGFPEQIIQDAQAILPAL